MESVELQQHKSIPFSAVHVGGETFFPNKEGLKGRILSPYIFAPVYTDEFQVE